MFWPTMITDSITSWMNVWLIHWMRAAAALLDGRRERDEREDSERVGTPHVPTDRRERHRDLAVEPDLLVGGLGGPAALRAAIRGAGCARTRWPCRPPPPAAARSGA